MKSKTDNRDEFSDRAILDSLLLLEFGILPSTNQERDQEDRERMIRNRVLYALVDINQVLLVYDLLPMSQSVSNMWNQDEYNY